MKLTIDPTVIYRVPKFPVSATLAEDWEELQKSIAAASPEFYKLVKDITTEELGTLPDNVRFTIWKYFNRSKYRATPFGSFAGFGIFDLQERKEHIPLIVDRSQIIHEFADWSNKNQDLPDIDVIVAKDCVLIANSTYYVSGDHLRYIAANATGFELCEEPADEFTKQILFHSATGIQIGALVVKLVRERFPHDLVVLKIEEMIQLQLLISELEPNIIGKDYFERLTIPNNTDPIKYLIAERPYCEGNVDKEVLKHLPGLLSLLQQTVPQPANEALQQFAQAFRQKFEQREVPLMLALDPEMGIGYNGLEHGIGADDFVMQFAGRVKAQDTQTGLKDHLLKKFIQSSNEGDKTIQLEDLLDASKQDTLPYPNSMNAIVSVFDELLCLEYLGGCTANSLLGRFTLASAKLHSDCKRIAQLEASANPDVLFFDIAYMSEGYVDNINRRQSVYNYQLSILNYDTSEKPLSLNDIMLSVQNGKLILRSQSINKRLVPKMASAYNYSRSDLPVFRFLCDLQFQGLLSHPLIKPENLLPGLSFYPRIRYRNIIVSPAKWNIEKEALRKWKQAGDAIAICRHDLQEMGVSTYFKAGASDQTLLFDITSDDDLEALIQYSVKYESILLKESLVPFAGSVRDQDKKPYHAEFILSITHNEKIYSGIENRVVSKLENGSVQSIFLPGKEWLYFEIYCHEQRTDVIIQKYISDFVSAHSADIREWFFIRYNEGGNHIRFRLRLYYAEKGQMLTNALSDLLHADISSGIISELLTKTYKREIERYHPETMEQVEEHFYKDSICVLSFLESTPGPLQLYQLCARTITKIDNSGIFNAEEVKHILTTISDSLNREHQIVSKDFKMLNERYKEYTLHQGNELSPGQDGLYKKFLDSFINVLSVSEPEKRPMLFIDLMHMHVNRLFSSKQRTHEMVIYYFAIKNLQRQSALDKLSGAVTASA